MKIKLYQTLSLIPLLLTAQETSALDYKILPGAACSSVDGSKEASVRRSGGEVVNIGSSEITVSCPVVNDVTGETAINTSEVTLKPNGNATSCSMTARRKNGSLTSTRSVSSSYDITVSLNFESNITASQKESQYYMDCRLPAGSSVVQYKTGE